MNRSDVTLREVRNLVLIGLGLFCVVLFAPNWTQPAGDSFIKAAFSSPWNRLLDGRAAWCSLKIIFLGGGIYLLLAALGKLLGRWQYRDFGLIEHNDLTWLLRLLQIVATVVFIIGGYCLIKALL